MVTQMKRLAFRRTLFYVQDFPFGEFWGSDKRQGDAKFLIRTLESRGFLYDASFEKHVRSFLKAQNDRGLRG